MPISSTRSNLPAGKTDGRIPPYNELKGPKTLWWFAASCLVFLILAVLMEMDRGAMQGFVSRDVAVQLKLTQNIEGHRADTWISEDGPIENLTAALASLSAVLLLVAIFRCRAFGVLEKPGHYTLLIAVTALMVFFSGEEVSWGQRVFAFGTPEIIRTHNVQQEFNLHNISYLNQYKDGLLTIGIFVWGVVLPIATLFIPIVSRVQDALKLPIPPVFYVGFFAAAIGYRIIFKTMYGNVGQEGLELLFALAMVLFGLHAAYRPGDLYETR